MRIRLSFVDIGVLACTGILSTGVLASAQSPPPQQDSTAPVSEPDAKVSKDMCLSCHGTFDEIVEASSAYVAPSGEELSPHRYMPHDSRRDEDVPECTTCHTAHPFDPLPEQGSVDLSSVTVQSCYAACHHQGDFTPCKTCHE